MASRRMTGRINLKPRSVASGVLVLRSARLPDEDGGQFAQSAGVFARGLEPRHREDGFGILGWREPPVNELGEGNNEAWFFFGVGTRGIFGQPVDFSHTLHANQPVNFGNGI